MAWVDYTIIGVIALSALIGFVRGFVREVLSFVIWFVALFVAWTFHKELAGVLARWIASASLQEELTEELARWITSPNFQIIVAFLILVLGVLVLGAILGYLLSVLLKKKGFTGIDRVLGSLFGAARGVILAAMLVFLGSLTSWPEDAWWRQSSLIGHFQVLAERILEQIPVQVTDRLKDL
ncbi:CvpA family protein [Candidatus Thiosymbion oneisti]|uniref:CvpA family protein n=1 Tax=Candidatus Thiosymbion oneisti TaxID=589554 RepID=UPI000B7DD397|nr:CvpA family protein [Candidatus Thiosymbion oneisti]